MKFIVITLALSLGTTAAFAQDTATEPTGDDLASAAPVVPEGSDPEAFRIATEQAACGELTISSAVYAADGSIEIECEDATAFFPLAGGLLPALGGAAAVAALAGAGGGGGAPSDTQ